MIQRIQSVFLAMVAILMASSTAFTYWRKMSPDGLQRIDITAVGKYITTKGDTPVVEMWPYTVVGILALLACGIAIYEISQFKNRLLQLKLGALNSLFMAGTLVLMIWFVNQNEGVVNGGARGAFLVSFYFPAAAMICNILANRFIKKDEKLVRSADRMR